MCHHCSAEQTNVQGENNKLEHEKSLKLNEGPVGACRICRHKHQEQLKKQDSLRPAMSPNISPTTSLSTSDRTISSCSDISVDVKSFDRSQEESAVPGSQEDLRYGMIGQLSMSGLESPVGNDRETMQELEIKVRFNGQEANNTLSGSTGASSNEGSKIGGVGDDEIDAHVWEPPEAEDPEDDMEGSVAFTDEDDECGDGTEWGKPSSLSPWSDEGKRSFKFKEKKQKAMEEVIHGKFKTIVGDLLKGAGVASLVKDGESWVDIVTSLSWEAASFLKPDVIDGKVMNPDGYVKVKCIATGSRIESHVFKGSAFKKHAALKRMTTQYKNPRLLLISGVLGQPSSGLSSFKSMEQEKDNLKSIIETIEMCHPNVVLVEKSVSRDVQESMLAKGMTLVYDMKLHRLERVARCTGSPILAANALLSQKLKQCDSFHVEKIVEEHAGSGEGGKKSIKTIMLIEGCPTRLGCTILLKGSHSDELKRVKHVMQIVVIMAYHLILETSFLLDWRAMCSTALFSGVVLPRDSQSSVSATDSSSIPTLEESCETGACTVDIPIFDGLDEGSHNLNGGLEESATISHVPYNPAIFTGFSSLSASLKRVVLPRDSQSSVSATDSSSIPTLEESCETGACTVDIPIFYGLDEGSHNLNGGLEESATISHVPYNPAIFTGFSSLSASLKRVVGFPLTSSNPYLSLSNYFGVNDKETNDQVVDDIPVSETGERSDKHDSDVKESPDKENLIEDAQLQPLSSHSEPILGSGEDIEKNDDQVQRKNDVNRVLDSQSILVLMSRRNALRGTICEQSHFSHIMFYRHFDVPLGKFIRDNLLNQTRQCSFCDELPEAHFFYYAHHNRQLTIRVRRLPKVLPGEAEGKLWMWLRCRKCKHDNGVAKSTKRVLLSTAARSLSFGKFLELRFSVHSLSGQLSNCGHLLEREFLYFFGSGPMAAIFEYSPVTTYSVSLPPQKLEFVYPVRHDALKQELDEVCKKGIQLFTGVAYTLRKLRSQFAGSTLNLHGLLKEFSDIEDKLKQERSEFEVTVSNAVAKNENTSDAVYKVLSCNQMLSELLLESFVWERRLHSLLLPDPSVVVTGATERALRYHVKSKRDAADDGRDEGSVIVSGGGGGGEVANNSDNLKDTLDKHIDAAEISIKEILIDGPSQDLREQNGSLSQLSSANQELFLTPNDYSHHHSDDRNYLLDKFASSHDDPLVEGNIDSVVVTDASTRVTSPLSLEASLESTRGWFWMPFADIRQVYMKDLRRGFIPKFQSSSSYIQEHVYAAYQLISEEGQRLHIPLGTENYIVRDYDGELSSIIACALAHLNNTPVSQEVLDEDGRKEGGISAKSTESFHVLTRAPTKISPHWSSSGSSDSDSIHSVQSFTSEDTRFSSFDGVNLLDSLVSPENHSPEVSLGAMKSVGKGKYSVMCLYAKHFRELRSLCCLSELDYIASLSRCKDWDAKGGKSKSFFAKTLDDRLIIKEIKKTEFESFVKFAPHYFKYTSESYKLGNQSCLAKVLGIYQVIVRHNKGGKEEKHDLMVMENLTFGRKMTRQYDLKGALHARYTSAADGSSDVLLDQNFVNDMNSSPLYVSNKAKRLLERAVWNDTTFLNSINVMDYSLLVGVDTERRELVCGIIDFLRQYTWDKQLETWVKSSLVVPKNVLPTVISPIEYKKRFRKFMSTHFLSVPDDWCLSDSCELCGVRNDGSHLNQRPTGKVQNGFSQ